MIFLGFLLSLAVVLGAARLSGGQLLALLDIPGMLFIVLVLLAALVSGSAVVDFIMGFLYLTGGAKPAGREELRAAVSAFRLACRASIAGGLLGAALGLIIFLVNMITITHTGPFLSLVIIPVFYGLFLSVTVFLPGISALEKLER